MDLLQEIAHCPNVRYCIEHPHRGHPCNAIVHSQHSVSLADHQPPEPWNGNLEEASILFLGSNPSINIEEEFPRWDWPDEDIADFFNRRFGEGRKQWIQDNRWLSKSGAHAAMPVKFWVGVQTLAAELFEVNSNDVAPGIDYCTSTLVHCKSRDQVGVNEALKTCVDRYLKRIVGQSGARVIVSLGAYAAPAVRAAFQLPGNESLYGPVRIGQHTRMFAFLPHPSARIANARKSFSGNLTPPQLEQVRDFLVNVDS